jgi:hypothetical protein
MKKLTLILLVLLLMANPITANAKAGIVEPLDSFAPLGHSILVPEDSFESLLEGFGCLLHRIRLHSSTWASVARIAVRKNLPPSISIMQ